jgi:hypothetical protein
VAKPFKRTRIWVDPPFQCRLLLRQVLYWMLIVVLWVHIAYVSELTAAIIQSAGKGTSAEGIGYTDFLWRYRFLLFGLVLTLPAVLYDLLKFSHRIAGPLFRCRRMMLEMADGKPVEEFKPRKNDLMRELLQAFNVLVRTCNTHAQACAAGPPPSAAPAAAPARNGAPAPQEVHA